MPSYYLDMNDNELYELISKNVEELYCLPKISSICWNFIDKYSKYSFTSPGSMSIFENYILSIISRYRQQDSDNYIRLAENKCLKVLWANSSGDIYPNSSYNSYGFSLTEGGREFFNAFEKLVLLFEKDKYVENRYIGCFIVWGVLRKVAIKYFSDHYVKHHPYEWKDVDRLTIEECYERYKELHQNGLIKNENGSFIYFLIKNKKVSENFHFEALKFHNYEQEKSKKRQFESFENELKNYKKTSIPLLSSTITINDVDLMTGEEFEHFIATLFKKMGFSAYVTQSSNDQGVDVVASKNDYKIGIQAKCYSSSVSNKAIQEITAGVNYYKLNRAIVVTNNYFTKSAINLAHSNNVVLWDRRILKEKIEGFFSK